MENKRKEKSVEHVTCFKFFSGDSPLPIDIHFAEQFDGYWSHVHQPAMHAVDEVVIVGFVLLQLGDSFLQFFLIKDTVEIRSLYVYPKKSRNTSVYHCVALSW